MAKNRVLFTKSAAKWVTICAALALTALADAGATIAQSGLARTNQGSSSQDPYLRFELSRRARHTTLHAPRRLGQAHQRWLATQAAAPKTVAPAPSATSPSTSAGTNVDIRQQDYQGETAIAINPLDSKRLVGGANTWFGDLNCPVPALTNGGTLALYASTDSGGTWNVGCAPWPTDLGPNPQDTDFGSDPAVAWDTHGNAYASYLLINISCNPTCDDTTATDALEVAKSTDSGATWTPLGTPVNSLGNLNAFEDKDLMAIDTTGGAHSNRIYVIWDEIESSGAQIERVAHSDDGISWTVVPVETDPSAGDIGGALAIGADGTVYAIWNRLFNGTGDTTVLAKSTDGGDTWSQPVKIASHNLQSFGSNNMIPAQDQRGINAFGAIAADRDPSSPNLGNLYVVYTDYAPNAGGSDTDIFLIRSTDGGVSWSLPLRVNNDQTSRSQFFAWVDVDQSTGNVAVSWYDARNDANNKRTQIFVGFSADGASSFQGNIQVSQPSAQFANAGVSYSDENSHDNVNFNPNQYGDYSQIAFLDGVAHPLWCDTRNFFPSHSGNTVAEDAATAQVPFGSGLVPATLKISRPHFAPQITLGGQGGQNQTPANLVLSIPSSGIGALPVQIQGIQITGNFSRFPNTPSDQCIGILNPGVPCTLPMAFSPTKKGINTGTVTILNNSTNPTRTITLRARGVQGKLTWGPRALALSRSEGPQPITLTNNNPVPLSIGTITVNNPDFVLGGSCMSSSSIGVGGNCQLNVTFQPSGTAPERGVITIPDDAAGAPHHVSLIGRSS